jgi:hypothetical protein
VENVGDTAYNAVYVGIKSKASSKDVISRNGKMLTEDEAQRVLADALAGR